MYTYVWFRSFMSSKYCPEMLATLKNIDSLSSLQRLHKYTLDHEQIQYGKGACNWYAIDTVLSEMQN